MLGQRKLDKQEEKLIKKLKIKLVDGLTFKKSSTELLNRIFIKFKKQGIKNVYLHFDMDVIDSSEHPAVLAPTQGGILKKELINISEYIRSNFDILGIGIANYIPAKDKNGTFVKYILELVRILTCKPEKLVIENYIIDLQKRSDINLDMSLKEFILARR